VPASKDFLSALPNIGQSANATRPLRVAFATVDIAGPYHCGGIGSAYQGLAMALASAGHDVTVIYTHDGVRGPLSHWVDWYGQRGIRFVHHPQPLTMGPWYAGRKEASASCYEAVVSEGPFDVIHFHEWLGLPYYSLVAKRLGLAFAETTLCVGTHGPLRWSRDGDGRLTSNRADLVVDFLERRSVALADVLVSPSRYLIDWMYDRDWEFPERRYVIPNVLLDVNGEIPVPPSRRERHDIRELVFFGRLDQRKGLPFFCDIMDRLARSEVRPERVTFLGSLSSLDDMASDQYLSRRTGGWPFEVTVESNLGREEALRYLKQPGRLAVIPTVIDNLPCTVQECAQEGIPFLTSDVGGIPEIVDAAAAPGVALPRTLEAFTERLTQILRGGIASAPLRRQPKEAAGDWQLLHETFTAADPEPAVVSADPRELPSVSVCMAHFERPDKVRIMLESLAAQTHAPLELIVADDGSRSEEAKAALEQIERDNTHRGWRVLRLENGGPGKARHAAAIEARGDYLLFVDDDDYAEPQAVEVFSKVAERTEADVLVSFYDGFEGVDRPDDRTPVASRYLPLGPALLPGLIYPELGGTMIFARRSAYFEIGGFPTERDADEDWELLLEFVAQGYSLEVIPERLFWYREQAQSRSRADNRFAREQRRVAIFEKMLPLELRDLAPLAYTKLAGAGDQSGMKRIDRVQQTLARAAVRRRAGKDNRS